MTKTIIFSFLVMAFISCENLRNKSANEEHDSKVKTSSAKESTDATIKPTAIEKEKLLGAWTDGSSENATFAIEKDSIFYTNEMASYPYSLRGDSLTIIYPDMSFQGIVYFINDTLILSDSEFGTTKYTRFKN